MQVVSQANSLQMEWCLECHRRPENFVRPQEKVFDMEWRPPADQKQKGLELVKAYRIQGADVLTCCWTCHWLVISTSPVGRGVGVTVLAEFECKLIFFLVLGFGW